VDTRIHEIAADVFRLSTFVLDVEPGGLAFNQFLMFPLVHAAVQRLIRPEKLRWISFGHYEADECGSMNEWLAAAPRVEIAHGPTACMVSLNDTADRAPRILQDGEAIDLGGRRVRYLDTPHAPHGWDAGLLLEETTDTLLCGDLFTQYGAGPETTESDIVGPAIAAEDIAGFSSLHPSMGGTLRRLAKLAPRTLALMHGPAFTGDFAAALNALGDAYDRRVRAAWPEMTAA